MKLIMAEIKTIHSRTVGAYVRPRLKEDVLRITANLGDRLLVDYTDDPSRVEQPMDYGDVVAIKLTEDWLVRFGFVTEPAFRSTYYERPDRKRRIDYEFGNFSIWNVQPNRFVQYVHELQILWYALEGEWLQLQIPKQHG